MGENSKIFLFNPLFFIFIIIFVVFVNFVVFVIFTSSELHSAAILRALALSTCSPVSYELLRQFMDFF